MSIISINEIHFENAIIFNQSFSSKNIISYTYFIAWKNDIKANHFKHKLSIKNINNTKHSENADNSTSVTFDLNLTSKVKKAYVIRCRLIILLYLGIRDVCE